MIASDRMTVFLLVFALILVPALSGWAQEQDGSIEGVVRDQQGGASL